MAYIPALQRRTGYTTSSFPSRSPTHPQGPAPSRLERFWQATMQEWQALRLADDAQARQQAEGMRSALDQLCRLPPASQGTAR